MSKKLIITIILAVLITTAFVYFNSAKPEAWVSGDSLSSSSNTVKVENGKQIILIEAKEGYKPAKIVAKADQSTTIKLVTSNTYDCSNSFSIPALKIFKDLPPTGTTEIEIPTQKSGSNLVLSCTMGMYRSSISFV